MDNKLLMEEIEEILQASDFQSVRFSVQLQNLTSSTPLIEGSQISLLELDENKMLVLGVPRKSCNTGHHLSLDINRMDPNNDNNQNIFHTTAKVIALEDHGEGYARITVSLIQFEESKWHEFLNLQANRQDEINQFLATVKG